MTSRESSPGPTAHQLGPHPAHQRRGVHGGEPALVFEFFSQQNLRQDFPVSVPAPPPGPPPFDRTLESLRKSPAGAGNRDKGYTAHHSCLTPTFT